MIEQISSLSITTTIKLQRLAIQYFPPFLLSIQHDAVFIITRCNYWSVIILQLKYVWLWYKHVLMSYKGE